MFKTHLVASLLIGLFTFKFFRINEFVFILILVLAGILPDIDIPNSKIGSKTKPISNILNILFGHRGFLHSIFIPIMFYFVFSNLKIIDYFYPLAIGYIGHLIIDALSYEGINFLFPLSRLRIQGFIKVGGVLDYMVFFILLAYFIFTIANIAYTIFY